MKYPLSKYMCPVWTPVMSVVLNKYLRMQYPNAEKYIKDNFNSTCYRKRNRAWEFRNHAPNKSQYVPFLRYQNTQSLPVGSSHNLHPRSRHCYEFPSFRRHWHFPSPGHNTQREKWKKKKGRERKNEKTNGQGSCGDHQTIYWGIVGQVLRQCIVGEICTSHMTCIKPAIHLWVWLGGVVIRCWSNIEKHSTPNQNNFITTAGNTRSGKNSINPKT